MLTAVMNAGTADTDLIAASAGPIHVWGFNFSTGASSDITQLRAGSGGTVKAIFRAMTTPITMMSPGVRTGPLFSIPPGVSLYVDKSTSNAEYLTVFYELGPGGE